MAKRKGKSENVTFARLDRLWTDITLDGWELLVAELAPESQARRHGPHVKGKCPFHDDSTASFCVTPVKGLACCFGCGKAFVDPVKFVAALKKCNQGEALVFLRKRFGLRGTIPDALAERLEAHEVYQNHKATLADFMCDQLLQAIKCWPDEIAMSQAGLYYAEPTVRYLMSRRLGEDGREESVPAGTAPLDVKAVWGVICSNQMVGVLPPLAVVQAAFGVDSPEFKFYADYFGTYLREGNSYVGWVAFMYHDGPRSVCRIKLRQPNSKEMVFAGDAYEDELGGFLGYFGLNHYRTFLLPKSADDQYTHTVCAFEGEFDTLSSIAQQIRRGTYDFFALALGGGAAQPMDRLASFGVSRIRIMPDDDSGGLTFAEKCVGRTKTKRLSFQVFQWPAPYRQWVDPADPMARIKDGDEAIKIFGYPRWARTVMNDADYVDLRDWCVDRAADEVTRSAVSDSRRRSQICQEWGALLTDAQDLKKYCDQVAGLYDLDSALMRRDIAAKDENEEEFVERLTDFLRDHYHPVGTKTDGRRRILTMWHKESRETEMVALNDERDIETFLSKRFGALHSLVREHLGGASFLALEGEDTSIPLTLLTKKYREYFCLALLQVARGLPSINRAPSKGQGIHPIFHEDGTMTAHVVNGRDVFSIDFNSDGTITAEVLQGPSSNGTIFKNEDEPWLPGLSTNLLESIVDPVALFLRIKDMIDKGWDWKHQTLDSTFLAAYVMCLSVMPVFSRQTAIAVSGEFQSGKSTFVSGFVGGGPGAPKINIVAHAVRMNVYTPASIRQQRSNSTLCLCLEEFEDYGGNDKKTGHVRGVLEMLRDLISDQPVEASIGTTSGEALVYRMRFAMATAAIRPLRDAASLSRFIGFELVHKENRIGPQNVLLNAYGELGIRATRRDLGVALIRYMPTLKTIEGEIEKEFASGDLLPTYVQSRFRQALYPILTMLKFLEQVAINQDRPGVIAPYRQFALDFSASRRDYLTRMRAASENEQLFDNIISSQFRVNGDDDRLDGSTNIRSMLSRLNELGEINRTKQGVYFDAKMEWIVVNWIEAVQGVLSNTQYRNQSSSSLKSMSERNTHHVPQEQVRTARTLERLVDVMGPCHNLSSVSVFSVRHILEAARTHREDALAGPALGISDSEKESSPNELQVLDDDVVV